MIDSRDVRKLNAGTVFALACLTFPIDACSRADGSVGQLPAQKPAAELAPGPAAPPPHRLTPAPQVGKLLFFDKSLSASGQMSCATLPRSGARLRSAERPGGAARRPQGDLARTARDAVDPLQGIHPRLSGSSRQPGRFQPPRPRRRAGLGRPRQLALRAGQGAAALAVRDGQRQPRRPGREAPRLTLGSGVRPRLRRTGAGRCRSRLQQGAAGPAVLSDRRPQLPPLQQQVRPLPLQEARLRADRRRRTRPQGLQGQGDGQLPGLSPGRRQLRRRRAGPVHRLLLRGDRRPAQPGDPRQPRPQVPRSRPLRPAP